VKRERSFSIVDIGASAGGLEAFQRFLLHLPSDTGMAFLQMSGLFSRVSMEGCQGDCRSRPSLDKLGMVGVATTTEVSGKPLSDAASDRFFAKLDRRQAVLFVHPSGSGVHSTTIADFTWSIGAPFEFLPDEMRMIL
jgi:hypothetical protein